MITVIRVSGMDELFHALDQIFGDPSSRLLQKKQSLFESAGIESVQLAEEGAWEFHFESGVSKMFQSKAVGRQLLDSLFEEGLLNEDGRKFLGSLLDRAEIPEKIPFTLTVCDCGNHAHMGNDYQRSNRVYSKYFLIQLARAYYNQGYMDRGEWQALYRQIQDCGLPEKSE
jgi:hypothetical protein